MKFTLFLISIFFLSACNSSNNKANGTPVENINNPATANNKTYTYLLTGGIKTHEQHLDEHEILNVEEYTIDEVKQLLKENKIAQCIHVAALHYGLAALEQNAQ